MYTLAVLPSERKARILEILKERLEISVQELTNLLEVPSANVRRDLRELETDNRILRRHGRAFYRPTLVSTPVEDDGDLTTVLRDELVAEMVAALDKTRNLFLTGGPVLTRVAKKLDKKMIATHDLHVAMAAAEHDNDVTLVGREVDNRTKTLRSSNFEEDFKSLGFAVAVVETDGLDEKNLWVARHNHALLPALLARTDSFFAVARSSRVGKKGDRVAGPLSSADLIVIDRGVSAASQKALADAGPELRVAGSGDGQFLDKVGNMFVFKRGRGRFDSSALAHHDDDPDHDAGHDDED